MPTIDPSLDRPQVVHGNRVAGDDAVGGIVHVIRDESELDKFREGEILVAAELPQHWSSLFDLAGAIITETDLVPEHVAEVVSTRSLALVTGVSGVTNDLRSGDIVMMHIDGTIHRLQDLRAPDSQMRVSVPAAVHARQFANQVDMQHANNDSSASVVALKVVAQTPVLQAPAVPAPATQEDDQIDGNDGPRKTG